MPKRIKEPPYYLVPGPDGNADVYIDNSPPLSKRAITELLRAREQINRDYEKFSTGRESVLERVRPEIAKLSAHLSAAQEVLGFLLDYVKTNEQRQEEFKRECEIQFARMRETNPEGLTL